MRRSWAVLVAAIAAAGFFGAPAAAAEPGITSTDVTFTGAGGVELHGTVVAPRGAAGKRPGLVLLEGAGNRGRSYLRPEAEAYARQGVVTLIYDKRTAGYSMVKRNYGLLADDALAAVRTLRKRDGVDPAKVGFWALSEGAWVAPIAANRSTDVAFIVTVGAVGVTPAAQTSWEHVRYLAHAGATGRLARTVSQTALGTGIDGGIFPESGFDPMPVWERVRQPVLAQWGELDRDAVPAMSSRRIGDALRRGGNTHWAVRVVPSVNHNLHVTSDDGFDRRPDLPAGYGSVEVAWIADPSRQVPSGPAFGPEPAATDPTGHGSVWTVVAGIGVILAGIVFGLTGLIRAGRSPRVTRWLAALASVTVAGTLLYLLFLLATAGKVTGPVLVGVPVIWLALQALAVATVATTIATVVTWRRTVQATGRVRFALLTAAGVTFVPWALHWALLLP